MSATEPRHRPHPAPTYSSSSSRAHPYAGHSNGHHHHHRRRSPPPSILTEEFPPSPPRSRHDQSQSPTAMKPQDDGFENLVSIDDSARSLWQ